MVNIQIVLMIVLLVSDCVVLLRNHDLNVTVS